MSQKIVDILKKGGVILAPTDTIWGLSADARNEKAIARIYQIKQRTNDKKMIVLFPSLDMLLDYTIDKSIDYSFLIKNDHPSTFIIDNNFKLPTALISDKNTVAIRIPKSPFLIELMNELNFPLTSTSANISSQPSPSKFLDISDVILTQVDGVFSFEFDQGTGLASSIYECFNGQSIVIRP